MAAVHLPVAAVAAAPSAKRRRIRGKTPDDAFIEAFGAAAIADELAHAGSSFLSAGVKRKMVHWTHGRTSHPDHVQPDALTREQLALHLEKCYTETYPKRRSPRGSIFEFCLVAEEAYAHTPPGVCPIHRHVPTCTGEQHYWNKVAQHSLANYKIKLNAVAHSSYAVMYAYVREPSAKKPLHTLDAEPYFSKFHPKGELLAQLLAASRRSDAMNRCRSATAAPDGSVRERAPQIYQLIRAQGLRTVVALQAFACAEADAGRPRLAELCTKQGPKLASIVAGAWAVADAPRRLAEEGMSLMDKLRRAAAEFPCLCGGAWAAGAERVLALNSISVLEFCRAVCRALEFGARRGVNVACVGTGGCGKSTVLESLELIFHTLAKPEDGSTFPLGNLPSCDIMLWQDYEHNEATVKFTDMLSLLVGESMELRAPGQLNTEFRNKAPLFYSVRVPLQCVRRSADAAQTLNHMMADRFATFLFETPLPRAERAVDWKHCGKCSAAFFLQGEAFIHAPPPTAASGSVGGAAPAATVAPWPTLAAAPQTPASAPPASPTLADAAPAEMLSRAVAAEKITSSMHEMLALYQAGVLNKDQW